MKKTGALTRSETAAVDWIRSQGWQVRRNGWPDFLCVRDRLGLREIVAVEVKHSSCPLTEEQIGVHEVLRAAGIRVVVIVTSDDADGRMTGDVVGEIDGLAGGWGAEVKAENVREFSHDEEHRVLSVTFQTGSIYEWAGVSREVYDEMRRAKNVDAYFTVGIKGRYASTCVHRPAVSSYPMKADTTS